MSLRGAIGRARKRVEEQGDYIASMEIRTRYTLIDPILQALGWNLDDPSLVQIEYPTTLGANPSRIEYALLSNEEPVVLVEAKRLPEEHVRDYKAIREAQQPWLKEAMEKFRRGEEIPDRPDKDDMWSSLTWDQQNQLWEYVEQAELRSGYAVLTNGSEWRISEIAKESSGRKYLDTVNILKDSLSRCRKVLGVLRRGRWK